jgi:predicted MFS family arabinose efflux permease
MLVVSGMFGMFFFVTQFLQGVLGLSPLRAGLAFLPTTAFIFATVQIVPRISARFGGLRLVAAGVSVALTGMIWLSRISEGTHYFPQMAVPMALLGLGIGTALTPLTASGIAGVAPEDAGAASGLVNVSQQLGASVGLSILVTLFAGANGLAHGVADALTGSAVFLALALGVVFLALRRPAEAAPAIDVAEVELELAA